jgi:CheY-like chemotaxis protein
VTRITLRPVSRIPPLYRAEGRSTFSAWAAATGVRFDEQETAAMDLETDSLLFEDAETPLPPAPRPRRATARALVVEDDPESARICSHGLERLGLATEVVWTTEAAIEALGARRADLAFVFIDLSLHGGAGRRVADEARRLHPASTIVEASASIGDVLGADAVVLAKPFNAEQFQSAFDAALFEGPVVPMPVYELPEVGSVVEADEVAAAGMADSAT